MEQRLSVVTLGVDDLDAAKKFYEALGWKCGNDDPGVAFFQLNGMILALYGRAALTEDASLPLERPAFGGITLAYNARSKEDVDRVFAQALDAGAKALKSPQDAFWGGYSGYFSDLDGHPWEVAWNPHWTLGEDGSVRLG